MIEILLYLLLLSSSPVFPFAFVCAAMGLLSHVLPKIRFFLLLP
jgi:uncharacterized membrane protein YdjX (TVP38/TMEM64 family)